MSDFNRLHSITDAMYLKAQQSLRAILQREAHLRGELRKLDSNAQAVRADHKPTIGDMRAIGADLLWEGWLVKTRAQLNLELARVLAQKEQNIGRVRKAFGKKTVSEKLFQLASNEKAKAARHRALDQAIGHSLQNKD